KVPSPSASAGGVEGSCVAVWSAWAVFTAAESPLVALLAAMFFVATTFLTTATLLVLATLFVFVTLLAAAPLLAPSTSVALLVTPPPPDLASALPVPATASLPAASDRGGSTLTGISGYV